MVDSAGRSSSTSTHDEYSAKEASDDYLAPDPELEAALLPGPTAAPGEGVAASGSPLNSNAAAYVLPKASSHNSSSSSHADDERRSAPPMPRTPVRRNQTEVLGVLQQLQQELRALNDTQRLQIETLRSIQKAQEVQSAILQAMQQTQMDVLIAVRAMQTGERLVPRDAPQDAPRGAAGAVGAPERCARPE